MAVSATSGKFALIGKICAREPLWLAPVLESGILVYDQASDGPARAIIRSTP
jgi:hypothetical protein